MHYYDQSISRFFLNLISGGFLTFGSTVCWTGDYSNHRSNQRSDPSHLKSLPENSKPMLRVDLKAKISMAKLVWHKHNRAKSFFWRIILNISCFKRKTTYIPIQDTMNIVEISCDVITRYLYKMSKSRKTWLPCTPIYFSS